MKVVIWGTFEMLSWSNQKGWSRKASNTQKRASHDIPSGILKLMLSCKQKSKDKASQPQQESALDHISGSQIIWVKYGFHYSWLVFTKLIIGLHIAIGVINWNLCDYPLLQHNKGIIVMCMIISSLTKYAVSAYSTCFIESCITKEMFKFIAYHYCLNDYLI